MTYMYSVDALAQAYAHNALVGRQLEEPVRRLLTERHKYTFAAAGFTLCTAAMVIAVAATFFSGSPLMAIFAFIAHHARKAFREGADLIGLNKMPEDEVEQVRVLAARQKRLADPDVMSSAVARYLRIPADKQWSPIAAQLLNFRLGMNGVPPELFAEQPLVQAVPDRAPPAAGAPENEGAAAEAEDDAVAAGNNPLQGDEEFEHVNGGRPQHAN